MDNKENAQIDGEQPRAEAGKTGIITRTRVRGSIGPKSEQGKTISSKNALKFGFFSKEVAIETPFYKGWKPKYKRILKALSEDWKPVGATEVLLLELAAVQVIQYHRLLRVQQALILEESTPKIQELDYLFGVENTRLRAEETGAAVIDPKEAEELLRDKIVSDRVKQKYKKEFEWQEQSVKEHERIDRWRQALPPPEDLEWLRTSENHILRHLYRALSELEHLQRMRLGDKVPPRLVLEVRKD
jgi:hypothetical protein